MQFVLCIRDVGASIRVGLSGLWAAADDSDVYCKPSVVNFILGNTGRMPL